MTNKKLYIFVSMLVVLALMLVGCSGAAEPAASGGDSGGGDAALKLTGMVDNEMAWAEDEVRAMDTTEAISTNKEGEESTRTGVSVNALLDEAGVQDGATSVAFVASDGYQAELSFDEVRGCADCIVAFNDGSGFTMVMPGFPGNVQVKGVIEIKVQ